MDDLLKGFIILSSIFIIVGTVLIINIYLVVIPAHEKAYSDNKPIFDLKSCDELEKIINYSTDQYQVFYAKTNYNERCFKP